MNNLTEVDVAGPENSVLRKSLGRFDIVFLAIGAVISIDTIAQIAAGGGAQAFTWAVVIAATFLFPYALVTAELGSTFREEGGPYVWVRLAFGRLPAAISTMLYWITNPIWMGGSLVFISAATFSADISPLDSGSVQDYLFKLVFIWAAIAVAVIGLRYGKLIVAAAAVLKVALIVLFSAAVVIYAFEYGIHGYAAGDFSPTVAGFLGVTPLLLFAFVGFEAPNGAAEEMRNPRRDVPIAVATSGTVAVLCYLIPIFGILAVVPAEQISGASGFLDAVAEVFKVFGPAGTPMLTVTAVLFIFVILGQASAWMIASDRVQASASADGSFFSYFGKFSSRLGTPVRMNLLSGIIATAFTIAATELLQGSGASVFTVVLTVAVTTLLLSYLFIFPTVVRLRYLMPNVERPYRVPGGKWVLWLSACLIYAWVVLGAWVALFPGTLEGLLGVYYDFLDVWGLDRWTFEVFTLGTLAFIVVLALGGYWWARSRRPAERPVSQHLPETV